MIRDAFDTDKLAFTELLGVPNAIRGVASKYSAPGQPFDTRYLTFLRFSVQEYPLDSILALISGA